jgi:PGF-CTERM protein
VTRRLAVLAVVVLAVGLAGVAATTPVVGDAGTGPAAAGGNPDPTAAEAHPTPPEGSPTSTAPERTPTGDGMMMRMEMSENGTVMNGNPDQLPPGCEAVDGTERVTVRGGTAVADEGDAFGFDPDRIQAPPCSRLVVTFVNSDDVRHQFMVHGLPTEVYPMGMFTIEVDGPGRLTGSFVTPAKNYTMHTHCSLPQHQQKGMQMSLVVGDGSAGQVGGGGHDHTHTAGGHSPTGVAGPGFGPVVAVAGLLAVALLAHRRSR